MAMSKLLSEQINLAQTVIESVNEFLDKRKVKPDEFYEDEIQDVVDKADSTDKNEHNHGTETSLDDDNLDEEFDENENNEDEHNSDVEANEKLQVPVSHHQTFVTPKMHHHPPDRLKSPGKLPRTGIINSIKTCNCLEMQCLKNLTMTTILLKWKTTSTLNILRR
jgi:hypothetical protein